MTEQELQILESMLDRIEACEAANKTLMESNMALIRGNKVLSDALDALRREYEDYTVNAVYEVSDPRFKGDRLFYPDILSIEETMEILLSGNKSICRFGDGEFACISGNLRARFTTQYSKRLSDRLVEILNSDDDNIMIAIADNYGDLSGYAETSRREIRNYMTPEIRAQHQSLLDPGRVYFNAYITRPYMYYYNSEEKMTEYWKRIKSLWAGKNLIIVEGNNTGFGAANDLLDDASDVKRIIAPAVDAFAKYDAVLETALEQSEDCLYLIALGPAATVLAYDLAKTGRRAIDAGHLDIEYEWMQRKQYRCVVPGKYVNEVFGGTEPESIDDGKYLDQIVNRVM